MSVGVLIIYILPCPQPSHTSLYLCRRPNLREERHSLYQEFTEALTEVLGETAFGIDVVTIGIVLSPSPATGAQNKSIRWLGVSPIPEAVEPTRPVRSMKHIVVHQHPTGADMRRRILNGRGRDRQ
jgi:hypothetical protein